jgi:hypothetical protein
MACVVAGLLVVTAAWGQEAKQPEGKPADVKPADLNPNRVYPVEIYSGGTRTIHYITASPSLSEQSAVRELERAENEAQYASDLLALRRQYVSSEQAFDPVRRAMQNALYGLVRDTSSSSSIAGSAFLDGSISGSGTGAGGWGWAVGYPFNSVFANVGVGPSYTQATSVRTVDNLAIGIGPEGKMKDELAPVIAKQATPEFAMAAARALQDALVSVPRTGGPILPVGGPGWTTVYLKSGAIATGKVTREDADWIVLDNDKEEMRIRTADVARMTKRK